MGVSAGNETAARGNDVGKCIGADFDFKHATIKSGVSGRAGFQIIAITEIQLDRIGRENYGRRIQFIDSDRGCIARKG